MAENIETDAARRPVPEWLTAMPIAHRGLHGLPDAPENSLAAFAAAVAAHFPIELDVRLLSDGQVAVFHDHDLWRLTGAPGSLEALSADDLRPLRLLGTGERIPLLAEVLDLVAGRAPLLVEIKPHPGGVGPLEQATLRALADYTGPFAIQSFRKETVAHVATHAPGIVRGQLASDDGWRGGDEEKRLPDFVAYNLRALPTPLSSALRARGVPLLAWTIQTPEQRRRAAETADNYIFETIRP